MAPGVSKGVEARRGLRDGPHGPPQTERSQKLSPIDTTPVITYARPTGIRGIRDETSVSGRRLCGGFFVSGTQ